MRKRKPPQGLIVLLLIVFMAAGSGRAQDSADSDEFVDSNESIDFDDYELSEEGHAADKLFDNAVMAEYREFWERAIELYKEGSDKYPDDIRFPWALGNLYYSRSLYGLAWDEYRKAELLNPYNTWLLQRMANTASSLNRDTTAVEYLERLLAINADDKEAISSLGWMYYKVHRLEDGERLLVEALDRLGDDPDFAMTLGTVYSDMYRYDEGKYWYQKSIDQAGRMRSFAAVAHYNLSILESRFYRYDLAMDEATSSLDSQNWASGLLARGEIHARRMDLGKALADFEAAREIDNSPLSKLNLAQTCQISGRLEEARLYALDCLKTSDLSWMAHYGIDPIRYRRDIHEILYKTYSGLSKAEKFKLNETAGGKINSLKKSLSSRFYSAVHQRLYRKYSLASADAYGPPSARSGEYPPLDQYIQYYNAFEPYPRRALFWLNHARAFETALIPAAEPGYDFEQGGVLKNRDLIAQALEGFDPIWERDMISHCYREFAAHGKTGDLRRAAAEELFAMNRGALLQARIRLPVEIKISFPGDNGRNSRAAFRLKNALAKVGFAPQDNARFLFEITVSEAANGTYAAQWMLSDSENAIKPLIRTVPLQSTTKKGVFNFVGTLSATVFAVR
jgi:hypothetical protein